MAKRAGDAQLLWMMEQEFFKLRYMQKGVGLPDSEMLKLLAKIFNLTEGFKEAEMILILANKLKTRERVNKLID